MMEATNATRQPDVRRRGPVVLIHNPHAGRATHSHPPIEVLAAARVTIGEQLCVSDLDDRHPRGAEWQARGMQAVIAAGGDGTIGTVAAQIVGTELPLGILPLGTSNDTARAMGGAARSCRRQCCDCHRPSHTD